MQNGLYIYNRQLGPVDLLEESFVKKTPYLVEAKSGREDSAVSRCQYLSELSEVASLQHEVCCMRM